MTFSILRRTTFERTDYDEAGSSWIAGVVIGGLAVITIIILVLLFRRRIMAKFFQPKNNGKISNLHPVSKVFLNIFKWSLFS